MNFLLVIMPILLWGKSICNKDQPRVLGIRSRQKDYPYHAVVLNWGFVQCSATIISHYYVITSGSCLISPNSPTVSSLYSLQVGFGHDDVSLMIKYYARNIIKHDDFRLDPIENDVALVRTVKPIPFNQHIQPIRLPEQFFDVGVRGNVSGFGVKDRFQTKRVLLYTAQLEIVDDTKCKEFNFRKNNCFCALGEDQATCRDDRGAGFISDGILVGILSTGLDCREGAPVIFTNIRNLNSWIEEVIGAAERREVCVALVVGLVLLISLV